MIVNLYVDHMMATPPASAEEVWNATREHSELYTAAASRIGLTPAEYHEFRGKLLDGKAVYVKLPGRLDAMAGNHKGNVYAVKNAVIQNPGMGWRVALADGNLVYVPQTCGNLSLLKHTAIALAPIPKRAKFTPAIATIPAVTTPVALVPPAPLPDALPVAPAAVPATVAEAPAAPSGGRFSPFLLAIPAAIGGVIAGISPHHTAPVCTAGSNMTGVCSK